MLFGMFFSAENLIFPAAMSAAAGKNTVFAYLGMLPRQSACRFCPQPPLVFSEATAVLIWQKNREKAICFSTLLVFSLHPGHIMTWIGKILNPLFCVPLFVLILAAVIHPEQPLSATVPQGTYLTPGKAFFTGFLEGNNTLDALAGIAPSAS